MTATESNRDSQENNSTLQEWALKFQDFLENCMLFYGMWNGANDGVSVTVNTDFSKPINLEFLLTLYRGNVISLETVQTMLKQAGVLPDDFDIEAEANKLANNMMMPSKSNMSGIASRLAQNTGL